MSFLLQWKEEREEEQRGEKSISSIKSEKEKIEKKSLVGDDTILYMGNLNNGTN